MSIRLGSPRLRFFFSFFFFSLSPREGECDRRRTVDDGGPANGSLLSRSLSQAREPPAVSKRDEGNFLRLTVPPPTPDYPQFLI